MNGGIFTYDLPDVNSFYQTLLSLLKLKQKTEFIQVLQNAKCNFVASQIYSNQRWDAYGLSIYFYVPIESLDEAESLKNDELVSYCNEIIPKENGYDVISINFQPRIPDSINKKSLTKDLQDTINSLSPEIVEQFLTEDIRQKGKEMSECYFYLYCVENTLRSFIEDIATKNFGDNCFESLEVRKSIQDNLKMRKTDELTNKWKRIRGDKELYYLDFKDLCVLIRSNWKLFQKYFPNLPWIETKINELAECRNLIAHNSYLGDHEKDVIRTNFNSILKQLEGYHN